MKNFNPTSAVIGALVFAGILSLSSATRVEPNRPDPTLEVLKSLTEAHILHAVALEKMASKDTQIIRLYHKISGGKWSSNDVKAIKVDMR